MNASPGLRGGKRILFMLASALLTFLILAASYEIYENIRYVRFKAFYGKQGDLYGNLTIASPNEKLIWEYRPRGESSSKTREVQGRRTGVIRTNRHGFRDRDDESPDRPAGVYRVAFIGDSVTLGLGVDAEATFVSRFEAEANGRGRDRKVQAMNFGIDGYDAGQVRELLSAKVLRFSPDQVVYVMCLNDFDFQEASARKIRYFRKPKSFFLKRVGMLFDGTARPKSADYHVFYFEENKQRVFQKLLEMRDILREGQIGFFVAILPVFSAPEEGVLGYKYAAIHAEIGEFLRKNGIPGLDLLEAFSEKLKTPADIAYDVWHLSEQGHRLVALALLDAVLSQDGRAK